MKTFLTLILASLFVTATANAGVGHSNQPFEQVLYFNGAAGKGAATGLDAGNAFGIVSGTIMALEAGMVVEKVSLIIDTAITGTTVLNVGDDDTAGGFCPNASITLGSAGMYCWDAKNAGSYLRIQTAGVTSPSDIYVVPNAKYYSAAKSLKLANTTTNTGGAFRIVVKGFKLGS